MGLRHLVTKHVKINTVQVLIVAESPADKHTEDFPLSGTRTEKTLLDWLNTLPELENNNVEFSVMNGVKHLSDKKSPTDGDYRKLWETLSSYSYVITLGNLAKLMLENSDTNGIKVLNLPHPSGRNRKLNDKKELAKMLKKLHTFIKNIDENN